MSLVLNNRRRVLNLVCILFYWLFPKEHHSYSSSSFLPSVSFRIHLCCTLKSVTHKTPPNCLLSNTLHSFSNTERRIQQWFIHFKQVSFRALENKLCAHDKNRKHAELWVKISLFNEFVVYALDSAHEKVRRMKRSQSFAVVFDKPGRIERQVDPNTNLPNLIDSNVELYMCRI